MRKSYKYRLYPSATQKRQLEQTLETCRWVYNETLAVRTQTWEEYQKALSLYDTQKLLPLWKQQYPILKQVFSQVLQNTQERVDFAFKAFIRRIKTGENPGYPRFKGRGHYDSFTFKQFGFTLHHRLNLSKIGDIKIKLHRPIQGEIKTLTIIRTTRGKWFACFSVKVEPILLPKTKHIVGLDSGLHSYLVFSDGHTVPNPRFFRKEEKALAKAQRRMEKELKGSRVWNKRRLVVSRTHERITNRRSNFAHQISRELVNNYDWIAFEKLNIQGMMQNHRLAKSIADAAWRQVREFTLYKAENAGRKVALVNPRNTSKQCSRCSQLVKKNLSERLHVCPHCGLELDRDLNAAINILTLGIQSVGFDP